MTQQSASLPETSRPTQVVAVRLAELRKERGWSASYLAQRMTEHGIPWKREIVANLEAGRRSTISVDELLALAVVFDVPASWLLVRLDADETPVTPMRSERSADVLRWLTVDEPLPDVRTHPQRRGAWQVPGEIVTRLRLFDRDANALYGASLSGEVTHQLASRVRKRADHVRQAGLDPVISEEIREIAAGIGVDLNGDTDGDD